MRAEVGEVGKGSKNVGGKRKKKEDKERNYSQNVCLFWIPKSRDFRYKLP